MLNFLVIDNVFVLNFNGDYNEISQVIYPDTLILKKTNYNDLETTTFI